MLSGRSSRITVGGGREADMKNGNEDSNEVLGTRRIPENKEKLGLTRQR